MNQFKVRCKVWLYSGNGGWHFVTLPKKQSQAIKHLFGTLKRGWGSLPVRVTIGKTTWRTSIFPDTKLGAYVLPLKSDVRRKEDISVDDMITLHVEIEV